MKKLRVAIVSHNGLSFLKDCLASVHRAGIKDINVFDNASNDGTRDWILQDQKEVKLIISDKNRGFGSAANQLMMEAIRQNTDYLLLLNQDTEIDALMISELTKCFDEDPRMALVSPVHKTQGGNFEHEFKKNCDRLNIQLESAPGLISVPFVNAACWLINLKAVKEIGGFNPIFFMYGEDLNYCHRAIHHGYKIGLCTKTSVIHKKVDGDYQSDLKKWCRVTSSFYLSKVLEPENFEGVAKILLRLMKRVVGSIIQFRFRMALVYICSSVRLCYLWPLLSTNRKKMSEKGAFLNSGKS